MAATPGDRRTSRRPGQPRRTRPSTAGRADRRRAERERLEAAARARAEERQRSRLTGRAAILVLVLAVLAVSYASSLRAYLEQRRQIDALEEQIEEREAAIGELEHEKARWKDPAYLMQEARKRGYVLPGETPYVVVDGDGEPLTESELAERPRTSEDDEDAWYAGVWESVKVAGDPPTRIKPPPPKRIVGSEDE